jgi:hypothetical protein
MFAPSRHLATALTAAALVASYAVAAIAIADPDAAAGTVTVTVQGWGSVAGSGIDCNQTGGPDCSQAYDDVQVCDPELKPPCHNEVPEVELTAGSDTNGYVFNGFTGCTSTSARSCLVTVDASMNITASFRDAQAPSVPAPSPATGAKLRGTINLSASPTDNSGTISKVEFRVRGALVATDTAAPFSASFDTATVPDGTAVVRATAYDAAGNAGFSESTITFDNTAPSLSVTGPNAQTFGPGTTQAWSFVVSDATTGPPTVECSLVAAGTPPSFGACSGGASGHSVTNKPEGSYSFAVRATDGAGNLTETSRSFAIDATPPDTSLTSGPSAGGVVAARTVSFGFAATEAGSTFECRLYPSGTTGPPFTPCSGAATHTASGLADGSYRFEVRGIDAVGNTDASPATRDFTVDATPPAARFAKVPKRTVKTPKKKAKVAFTFTSEAGVTFRCSLDGAAYAPCSASLTLKVKAGKHTLSVVAVDSAGNTSTPATRSWKVKRIPPHR